MMESRMIKWNKIRMFLGLHPIEVTPNNEEEMRGEWIAFISGVRHQDCNISSSKQFEAFEIGYKLHGNFDLLTEIGALLVS